MKKKPVARKKAPAITSGIAHPYQVIPYEEVQRYMNILSEDFRGHVQIIAEQVSGLSNRVEHIDERMEELDGRMGGLEGRMAGVENRLGNVETTLDSHTEMIGHLLEDVQEIKHDLKEKVDRKEFDRLEKRVLALELKETSHAR